MTADEKRAYARGYQAGGKRKERLQTAEQKQRRRSEYWKRCYVAALAYAMEASGWKRADKPISDIPDRAKLCGEWADAAVKTAEANGHL